VENIEILDETIKIHRFIPISMKQKDVCPICEEVLTPDGRCRICYNCLWSACEI
jgi:hypothetical protein